MPVVPTSHDFATGVATSTEANAYIQDPIEFLRNPPIARLRQTTLNSLVNATFTSITFQTEDVDKDVTGGEGHSTSVNTSRYTAQYPGYYEVSGGVAIVTDATGQRACRWVVNGSAISASSAFGNTTGGGNGTILAARVIHVYLQIGDYVELQGFQNRGSALDTLVSAEHSSSMDVRWVSN